MTERTTMNRAFYFPAIDGLRFFAFFIVFLRHFRTSIPTFIVDGGWIGVELFFLISGFLLTRLLKQEFLQYNEINAKNYYIRRILRTWPLYFVYLAGISIYTYSLEPYYLDQHRLLGNIFFYDNFISATDNYNRNLFTVHLWSISMEEQYYLLLPFIVPWLVKQNRKTVTWFFIIIYLLMVAGRVISVANERPYPFIYVLPISGDSFLAGMLLGLGIFDKLTARINSLAAFAIALLLFGSLYLFPPWTVKGYHEVVIYTIIAIGFVFLFISIKDNPHKILSLVFTNRVFRYLGKISFGLYIYHILAMYVAARICEKSQVTNPQVRLALAFAITVSMSILSYEFFEKRVLRYKKRFAVVRSREP